MYITDTRPLHSRALDLASSVIDRIGPADLARSTPCAAWDLAALLGHMIGQNYGFAASVRGPLDAPPAAFAARPPGADPAAEWRASAGHITEAFAAADLRRAVLLAEVSGEQRFPAWIAIGFQLLDTVVHGWDVATALGVPFAPDDELATATLRVAEAVPGGPAREHPGASFAPVLPAGHDAGDWHRALALLGREPQTA